MTGNESMGRSGMALACTVTILMWGLSYAGGALPVQGQPYGICLPAPVEWLIPDLFSNAVNFLLLAASAIILWVTDRRYALIPGDATAAVAMMLVMASSNRWISGPLNSSCLLLAVNMLCLQVLFGCYRKHNVSQQLFFIATLLALGSMVQYAFLFMIPVYLIGAIIMKCLDLRSALAFLIGLLAPYWTALGFRLVSISDFRMPELGTLEAISATGTRAFSGLLSAGLTILLGLLMALNNMVRLYSGSTRRRLMNNTLNLLGAFCTVCIAADFTNLTAYLATLYAICAMQLANTLSMWRIRRARLWLLLVGCIYSVSFIFMLI